MAELAEPTIEQLREELKCALFKAQTAAADTEQLTERNRKLEDAKSNGRDALKDKRKKRRTCAHLFPKAGIRAGVGWRD